MMRRFASYRRIAVSILMVITAEFIAVPLFGQKPGPHEADITGRMKMHEVPEERRNPEAIRELAHQFGLDIQASWLPQPGAESTRKTADAFRAAFGGSQTHEPEPGPVILKTPSAGSSPSLGQLFRPSPQVSSSPHDRENKIDAIVLGIPRAQFPVLPDGETDYKHLKIGNGSYSVHLPTMLHIQEVVEQARATGAGYIVQRLEPDGQRGGAAFLLFTGINWGPLRLEGVAQLARKLAELSKGGSKLNLTLGGIGTPMDFDAVKLAIVSRSRLFGSHEATITYDTPEVFQPIDAVKMAPMTLSPKDDVTFERRGHLWVAGQRIGEAWIRAIAKTRMLTEMALTAIRVSLASRLNNRRLLDDDHSINHTAFTALPREEQRELIDAAVEKARKLYDGMRMRMQMRQAGTRIDDGIVTIEKEFHKQKRSVRFAGLRPSVAIRAAAIGQANASH